MIQSGWKWSITLKLLPKYLISTEIIKYRKWCMRLLSVLVLEGAQLKHYHLIY
jgi:hypothetical protein